MARGTASHGGTETRRFTEDDPLATRVIGAALHVHTRLGPGLLESIYERCLMAELQVLGLHVERQVTMPLRWRGVELGHAYRLDLLVEGTLAIEVKATPEPHPVHEAQLLTYLRLAALRRGLLLNFGLPRLKDGITRLTNFSVPPPCPSVPP